MSDNTTNTNRQTITTTAKLASYDAPGEGKQYGSGAFKITGDIPEGSGLGRGGTKILIDSKVWTPEIMSKDSENEVTAEIVFERVEGKDGKSHSYFLTTWNGVSKPAYEAKGGKGGGQGNYKPKTVDEIHSASICGLVKSALELAANTGKTEKTQIDAFADIAMDAYIRGIEKARALKEVA